MRRIVTQSLGGSLALFCLVAQFTECLSAQRPNIVVIVADDLGWNDVSFHGSDQIPTPNIDALAYGGIILNNYYVSPICTPTRGALMSGRHPIHTGLQRGVIVGAAKYGLPLEEKIMPQWFQQLGYRTHMVGKEYWGVDWRRNLDLIRNETNLYSTDLFTVEAVNIINKHDTSQPLFLYLPHQAVHSGNTGGDPLQAPQHYVDRFLHIKNYHRRLFAGMVAALDDSIGTVVKTLESRGMMNNTIIMFTTDNGGPANGFDANAANNFPLRGVKATLWEGGVRGVGFIHSPLLKKQGYVYNNMLHVCDWLPTLYKAAGGSPSVMKNLDGYDHWESLSDKRKGKRKEILHNIDPKGQGHSGLRVGDYKILVGDVGMSWDDWYPPWQNPADTELLHINNTQKYGHFLNKKESAVVDRHAKYFNKMVASNMGYEMEIDFDNEDADKVSPMTDSYYHKGAPVRVDCGPKPFNASTNCDPRKSPCLFHIPSDPCEYNNIAEQNKDLVIQMLTRLMHYENTMVPPLNGPEDPAGNPKYHDGAWVPWVKL
ncbi:arylsulfatase B-like isoform X8 [Mercenaria mercenaria]|uniref:arylsulfatase B-like isoform X8 n=1 Tax=Mercenaria mercenaria TaxID=6596 RepID=UPI00234E9962|nr:arylsulfatase B-like isoform X8 [Mercenaria mercenaria]